jgi:hypothetical protein
MRNAWEAANAILLSLGADTIEHPGGTLLEHVRRVQRLLSDWGANTDVQIVGLCHAIYGTDGFHRALLNLDQREILEHAIGVNAESLVYLYGSCDRAYVYQNLHHSRVEFRDRFTNVARVPDETSVRAFVEITAANELDVVRHNNAIAAAHGEGLLRLFESAKGRLSACAWESWQTEPLAGLKGAARPRG